MLVAPLVGAWIEIACHCLKVSTASVAPLVGAWIEINLECSLAPLHMSLPSWERGLKFFGEAEDEPYKEVAPLVGAWIEMEKA